MPIILNPLIQPSEKELPARYAQRVAFGSSQVQFSGLALSFASCQFRIRGLALNTGLPLRKSVYRKRVVWITDCTEMISAVHF